MTNEYSEHLERVREQEAARAMLAALGSAHCLATSPRFQSMTVADAIAEMQANNVWTDAGAAIAQAKAAGITADPFTTRQARNGVAP